MKIDYVELPAPDLAAMKAFYGQAFGWSFKDYGENYADILGAGMSAGLNPHAVASREGALVILYSDDLEAAETAVTGAGAEIVARHDFPGGRRIHFVDPCGNELAIWTKADA